MPKFYYSLGFMSGTSLDGIDASIIKSDGEKFVEIIDNKYIKYNDKLRSKLTKIVDKCTSKVKFRKLSQTIRQVEKEMTILHAKLFKILKKKNNTLKIDLIGFHGQTILHKPKKGYSFQIGNSKLLSKLTKTKVISNFREIDIINGGQGSPLTPLYHKLILLKIKSKLPAAVINIGGITNITYLKNKNKIISFDTGPGNCLLDKWVKNNIGKNFDEKGAYSKQGKVNKKILKKLLSDPYYKKKFPKSLDTKNFNLRYVNKLNNMTKDDLQSMLSSLGIKKTSYPFLPEECKDNDADRLAAIYISRKSANAIVKSKELEIRELKRQVSTLQHDVSEKVSIAEILNKGFENIDSESYALGAHSASKTCRVICFSDWHVGVEIKSSDLNSDNDYNIDIVKERINKCIEYISNADISEQDEIYIAFLGDMMDGMLSNMKPLMAVEHDLHGIEQLVSASDIIIDLIYRLYKLFDRRMTILTVGGNHDRLTEKKIQDKNRLAHLVLFDRVRLFFRLICQIIL